MATLQVKGLDDGLYEALKALAARESRSVSQQVVHLVKAALASPRPSSATQDFLALAGTWEDPRDASVIVAELRGARGSRRRDDALLGVFGESGEEEPADE